VSSLRSNVSLRLLEYLDDETLLILDVSVVSRVSRVGDLLRSLNLYDDDDDDVLIVLLILLIG